MTVTYHSKSFKPAIFESLDVDKEGQISYTEFLAASLGDDLQNDSKVLRKLFDSLDVTKDGKISAWDLEQLLGSDLGKYNVDSLLREGDTTGDMEIYFDEFVTMMKSSPYLTLHA